MKLRTVLMLSMLGLAPLGGAFGQDGPDDEQEETLSAGDVAGDVAIEVGAEAVEQLADQAGRVEDTSGAVREAAALEQAGRLADDSAEAAGAVGLRAGSADDLARVGSHADDAARGVHGVSFIDDIVKAIGKGGAKVLAILVGALALIGRQIFSRKKED